MCPLSRKEGGNTRDHLLKIVRDGVRLLDQNLLDQNRSDVVDTIIFIVLLVAAIVAYKGMSTKVVLPVFVLAFVLTFILFRHHVTSQLPLQF